MTDTISNERSTCSDCLGISPLFRAFKLSCGPAQFVLCLVAVLVLYLIGAGLDGVWPKEHRVPAVLDGDRVVASQLTAYLGAGFDVRAATVFKGNGVAGPFAVMWSLARHTSSEVIDAIFSVRILTDAAGRPGVFRLMGNFPFAVIWLCWQHWVYFVLFFGLSLAVMSVLGGAAYRVAAVGATRDDSISISDGLAFAKSRFASFAASPLLPIAILVFLYLVMGLAGLVAGIPWVGELLAGIFWVLALLGGIVMAVVAIGLVTGWPLWFPTIAVEGSDTFDAFSRSFSYVYQRPWRATIYWLVALAYGAACFVFVRFVAWLALKLVHLSVGWGLNIWSTTLKDGKTTVPKLDAVWTAPAFDQSFWGGLTFDQVGPYGTTAMGFLMMLWTSVFIFGLAAWALSFFVSASTLIYLQLRREVDGADLEEIWLAEDDEERIDAPAAAPAAATSTSLPIVQSSSTPPTGPG